MRIFEFIDKYCADLVEKAKQKAKLIDFSDFPHDSIDTDATGEEIPVVYVDNLHIPVIDFLSLDKDEFLKAYKTPGAEEAYVNYISALEILEGEDIINRVRNEIASNKKLLEEEAEAFVSMI